MVFSRSVFSNIEPDIVFFIFSVNNLDLSIQTFYIVIAFLIPTNASTIKKCFFIDKNTFFYLQSPICCPTTFYVPESPPHNHKSLQKKKNTIHFLFIGKNGSAGKVIRPGFQLQRRYLRTATQRDVLLLTSYFLLQK